MMPHGPIDSHVPKECAASIYPVDGGITLLWYVGNCLPDCVASLPRRWNHHRLKMFENRIMNLSRTCPFVSTCTL
jgi:hypothetical protein